ncbi:P-loop containing nucleoside triphosphate hydrolase protein [Mycena galopus ATCC 62051]|nr:P-loop containing nucleoside triphosphate hydrolase protein [Mycena galopus ATCC 62051]
MSSTILGNATPPSKPRARREIRFNPGSANSDLIPERTDESFGLRWLLWNLLSTYLLERSENPSWAAGQLFAPFDCGQGGNGGGGGVQGQGGAGGLGEGPGPASSAVGQASQILNHCPPPSRIFRGRQAILNGMHEFFATATGKQHIYVLHGLGGIGKTQIALKFIEEFTRLVVDMSTTETAEISLKTIAMTKQIGNSSQEVLKWLEANQENWLLFFDNLDDPQINLNRFLPKCNHGNIIITSRNPNLRVVGAHSQVTGMEEGDAVALLLRSAGQETSPDNELLASEIVKVLWHLPLAIVQAGAFILESGSLNTYLALYSKSQARLLTKKPTVTHDDYAWSAYTTWQISFDRLSPPAAKLLQLCSFLHQDGISEDIFSRGALWLIQNESKYKPTKLQKLKAKFKGVWSRSPISLPNGMENPGEFLSQFVGPTGEWDALRFREVINEIKVYSLINFDAECKSFSIHPMVHDWSRTTLTDPDPAHLCMTDILGMSIQKIPSEDVRLASLTLVFHLDMVMRPMPTEVSRFGLQYARIYRHAGRYAAAKELEEAVLQQRKKLYGDAHLDTLFAMTKLAKTYDHLGQSEEAKTLKLVVLEKLGKFLGENHLDTIKAMHSLAVTYSYLGQFQEAQKLQLVVLEKRKKHLGDAHLDTLDSMTNLATTYGDLGQFEEAEKLEVVVLEERRKLLGDDHLDTLNDMENLAITHDDLGQFKEAEKLKAMVLEKRRKLLGNDHPDTLFAMNNLGHTYYCLGQFVKAEELQVVAVEKQRKLFGDNHPHSQRYMRNLARTYRRLNKRTEMEELKKLIKKTAP